MTIRKFKAQDKQAYVEMSKIFYSNGATLYPVNENNFLATFELICEESPFVGGFIFEDNGEVIGYAHVSFTYSNEAGGEVMLIEEIYVDEKHRSKGIGTKFLQWLFNTYPNTKRFRLEVCHSNTGAVKLYNKLGFKNLDYIQMVKE